MIRLPQCNMCKHKHPYYDGKSKLTCVAFPDGVPDEIGLNRVKHTEPYPGDNGIVFERREGADPGPILTNEEARAVWEKREEI